MAQDDDVKLPEWYNELMDTSTAVPAGLKDIPSPPGFNNYDKKVKKDTSSSSSSSNNNATTKPQDTDSLKVKKAWEVALAPAKSLPMNLFMSYMSGNSLQIVPIMMTSMMFFMNPLKQIWGANKQFETLLTKTNRDEIRTTKLIYVACQLLAMCAGVWKLSQMGLLPNTRSDWLAWEDAAEVRETSI